MDGEVGLARLGQHVDEGVAPAPPAACRRSRGGRGRSRWRAVAPPLRSDAGPASRRIRTVRRRRRPRARLPSGERRSRAPVRLPAAGRRRGRHPRPRPTSRSHQPVSPSARTGGWAARRRIRWRRTMRRAGRHVRRPSSCQATGAPAGSSVGACALAKAGLVSTRWTRAAARKAGTTRAARSASAISVPRPGPSSTRREARAASPCGCQASTHQRPISSPNIWLISGAVTKSPPRPKGSRVM